jgi:hypothetical protein
MVDLGYAVSLLLLAASVGLNALVLAYRSPRTPRIRSAIDRMQRRLSGRSDWSWLRLRHLLVPLAALAAINVTWQVATLHCGDDSLALLASGQAALHGQNPFVINYCSYPGHPIPYGLAAVTLDMVGSVGSSVAGIWIVWTVVALAIVPLVWVIGGEQRRYLSILTATSVLYLPNLATDIGLDNAIVPVAVLGMLGAIEASRNRRGALVAVSAFLSTARFPAVFPLLGVAGVSRRDRWSWIGITLGVFLAAILTSYALWGWDAIGVVYLGEFARNSGTTLNLFALLLREGWFLPSLTSAAVQGGVVLALVVLVGVRGYSTRAAVAIPLLGVMSVSQYLDFHFVLWLVPLVLLGPRVNAWLLAYGVGAALDTILAIQYLGESLGVWWPYEFLGVALSVLLLVMILDIIRDEESRPRPPRARPSLSPSEPFARATEC